ncbi:nucleotide-binding domain-containing protein [Tranquillimonas alkanivorans]|uniref:nucleotide-binding domain-containing protein n=1 Tax=Tranquillimonas alkanivorans TaxID=441119 RepID=UPI0011606A2B|nr:hypothetical protein [Tranquillimonas alkanivorans]
MVGALKERLSQSAAVPNPGNTRENLNRLNDDDCDAFIDRLSDLRSITERALASADEYGSADIWSEAFKHFFPFPEEVQAVSKAADSAWGLPTVVRHALDVRVAATSGKRRWEGVNNIGPIPKGCDIEFTIADPNALPEGAVVYWTVRNQGAEAEVTNDLGHISGTGLMNRESSAYRGSHFMDVVAKLNGEIIGRRRVKIRVSGIGLPERNPARPTWTKFRRK